MSDDIEITYGVHEYVFTYDEEEETATLVTVEHIFESEDPEFTGEGGLITPVFNKLRQEVDNYDLKVDDVNLAPGVVMSNL